MIVYTSSITNNMNNNILHASPNWIFVSFTHGAFGHLLGRCLMTGPDTAWYDHPVNGDRPWNWNHFPVWSGWGTGFSHFIRGFNIDDQHSWHTKRDIPGFGQWNQWHPKGDENRFSEEWINELALKTKLVYTTHDYPEYLKSRFPNCKVVCVRISDNDWVNCVKNQLEKTGSYTTILNGITDPISEADKFDWSNKTGFSLLRDWEKYKLNLNDEEYVEYTVKVMQEQESIRKNQNDFIDCFFDTENKFNIDAIVQLHKDLDISHDADRIKKVLDAFNLDNLIRKFL